MTSLIKSILKFLLPPGIIKFIHDKRVIDSWEKRGKPVPPPSEYKQNTIRKYGKIFKTDVLIETGTYKGAMVKASINHFSRIYSIELDKVLAKDAQNTFKEHRHVSILEGDSTRLLNKILPEIKTPCIFWLDAHYSSGITARGEKDTPIMEELNVILKHPLSASHVILIDDARDFNGRGDYPSVETLRKELTGRFPSHIFEVKDNIIRFHKKAK